VLTADIVREESFVHAMTGFPDLYRALLAQERPIAALDGLTATTDDLERVSVALLTHCTNLRVCEEQLLLFPSTLDGQVRQMESMAHAIAATANSEMECLRLGDESASVSTELQALQPILTQMDAFQRQQAAL